MSISTIEKAQKKAAPASKSALETAPRRIWSKGLLKGVVAAIGAASDAKDHFAALDDHLSPAQIKELKKYSNRHGFSDPGELVVYLLTRGVNAVHAKLATA